MMEPDDDDMSHSGFDNVEMEDPPFCDEATSPIEENLPSLLEEQHNHTHKHTQKRVGGAAVCGGVTGALLSVPLVAVDVTVLAVAGPAIAAAAAGGAAVVAAKTAATCRGETKEEDEEHRLEWFPHSDCKKPDEATDESSTESSDSKSEDSQEVEESVVKPPTGIGLRAGGLMWIMSQKKQMDEELEVTQALKELDRELDLKKFEPRRPNEVSFFKEATRSESPGNGPLGWLRQRRLEVPKEEVVEVEVQRGWFGRPVQPRCEQDDTENEDQSSDDDCCSDEGSEYSEQTEDVEEEIVFDESCYGSLFSDGLVEQAAKLTV